jgi:hypothetical protein
MRPLTRRLLTAVALTASLGVALAGCDKKDVGHRRRHVAGQRQRQGHRGRVRLGLVHPLRPLEQRGLPAFKAKYIDTGRVNYVYREFLTAPAKWPPPRS